MATILQLDQRMPIDFSSIPDLSGQVFGGTVVLATAGQLLKTYPAEANPAYGNPLHFPASPGDVLYNSATLTPFTQLIGSFAFSAPGVVDFANSTITGIADGYAETGAFYNISGLSLSGSVLLSYANANDGTDLLRTMLAGANSAALLGTGDQLVANHGTADTYTISYGLPSSNYRVAVSLAAHSTVTVQANGFPIPDSINDVVQLNFTDETFQFGDGAIDISGTGLPVAGTGTVTFEAGTGAARLDIPLAAGGTKPLYLTGYMIGSGYAFLPDGNGGTRVYQESQPDNGTAFTLTSAALAGSSLTPIFFGDPVALAAARTAFAPINAAVASGSLVPYVAMADGSIPAPPTGKAGELIVSQFAGSNSFVMHPGYTTALVLSTGYQTVLGGNADGQMVVGAGGGLRFVAGAGAGTVTAFAGSNAVSMFQGAGNQAVMLGAGDDTVIALGGNNTIAAGAGSNMILLGAGSNMVTSAGNDLIAGGTGSATITAGSNAPTVYLGSGANLFQGGSGGATVVGTAGADTLTSQGRGVLWLGSGTSRVSSDGADTIIGSQGTAGAATIAASAADLVFGGLGTLNFTGGLGVSTVIGNPGGTTTVTSGAGGVIVGSQGPLVETGGAGVDTVIGLGGSMTVNGGAGGGIYLGGPAGSNRITAGSGQVTIFGGGAGDVLTAGPAAGNIILAGPGAETISGAGSWGSDAFYGGSGPNTFLCGSGTTSIQIGSGNTTITAGSGLSLFAFVQGHANNVTLQGLNPALDYLSLQNFGTGEAATAIAGAQVSGGNSMLTLSDGTRITFSGFTDVGSLHFL